MLSTARTRWMRSGMAAKSFRGTATSAVKKTTYRECVTTFAPILISFSATWCPFGASRS